MNGTSEASGRTVQCRFARWMTVAVVLLTATVSLVWAHAKLMSQDEMYAFQTDSVSSLAKLIEVQRKWPISLDPLLMHGLSHAGMQVLGVGPFALRLPALAGFLGMQACLFFFVRRMAGDRAGMVAAAFPALTATLFYSAEGRPYGLMLGLYGMALMCWQACIRSHYERTSLASELPGGNRPNARGWALAGLAVAIAATLNAHYFGVLLLVPVCGAEAFRTWRRRRPDMAVVLAICAGIAGFAGTLPFLKGAGEFKKNYYNGGTISLHDITRAYRAMFLDYTQMSMTVQHLAMVILVVLAAWLVGGCVRVAMRSKATSAARGIEPPVVLAEEWVILALLAALPFCGYLLAKYVTHSIEVRYVLGALVALSAMVGIAVSDWLRRDGIFQLTVAALLVAVIGGGVVRVRAEKRATAATMAALALPPDVKNALNQMPDGTLYLQDMGKFEVASYYEPDPEVRTRMALVYSSADEIRWNRHDTMALTAMHLQHFTALHVVPYEALRSMSGEHIFALYHTGWDWTDQAFAADSARVRPVGQALNGEIVAVTF